MFVKGERHPCQWRKGQSGNPRGRIKDAELRALAREHTALAVNTLVEIARDRRNKPTARTAAANSLLDRGWGRAAVSVEVTQPSLFDHLKVDEVAALHAAFAETPAEDTGEREPPAPEGRRKRSKR